MNTSPFPRLDFCDIEVRQDILILRARKDMMSKIQEQWWNQISRLCPGPYHAFWIDLFHCQVASSSFIAGALQLLDHYRNDSLQNIILLNVSDRIVRLIDIMNLQQFFVVRQHQSP